MNTENHTISILKACSWRVFATITTIVICFVMTGNIELSTSIGLVELVLKIALYYVHERLWLYFMTHRHASVETAIKTEVNPTGLS